MKKVLILGSSGFIGGALVKKMYQQNFCLSIILRDFSKAGYVSRFKDVKINYFGLDNKETLMREINNNDIIINCIHDFGNQKFNLKLIQNICEIIEGSNKKFIHMNEIPF